MSRRIASAAARWRAVAFLVLTWSHAAVAQDIIFNNAVGLASGSIQSFNTAPISAPSGAATVAWSAA